MSNNFKTIQMSVVSELGTFFSDSKSISTVCIIQNNDHKADEIPFLKIHVSNKVNRKQS